jgi:hypothetical protein
VAFEFSLKEKSESKATCARLRVVTNALSMVILKMAEREKLFLPKSFSTNIDKAFRTPQKVIVLCALKIVFDQ